MSLILADYPLEVGGATVNRLCGSGLEAVAQAARAVMLGEADVYVGGGVESMSRAPLVMPKPEKAFQSGNRTVWDTTLGWRMTNPEMERRGHTDSLGMTAENLADEREIPRVRQDRFALHSHEKAVAAMDAGRFADETVPRDGQGPQGRHRGGGRRGPAPRQLARGAREAEARSSRRTAR